MTTTHNDGNLETLGLTQVGLPPDAMRLQIVQFVLRRSPLRTKFGELPNTGRKQRLRIGN